jgi:hypothetical protein
MAQSPGFDMSKLSTATKILVPALVLFILLTAFVPINSQPACTDDISGIRILCRSFSLWFGIGFVAGLLALAMLVLEVLRVLNVRTGIPPKTEATVELGLAGGVVLFTLLRVLIKPSPSLLVAAFPIKLSPIGAIIAVVLALAVAYGAYMRYHESQLGLPGQPGMPPGAAPPPPPPPAGGSGFTG